MMAEVGGPLGRGLKSLFIKIIIMIWLLFHFLNNTEIRYAQAKNNRGVLNR